MSQSSQVVGAPVAGNVLVGAAEAGRLADLVAPASPARTDLVEAGRRFARPLRMQVIGRPGTGRDTMARALRSRLAIAATGPSDDADASAVPDLWVYLLTGPARQADLEGLREVPSDRCIVVLGKADTIGGVAAAADRARRCAASVGRPVYPVSALLACAEVTARDIRFLRMLAATDEPMPELTGRFLSDRIGSEVPDEAELRAGLLRRLDRYGITRLISLVDPSATGPTPEGLSRILHAESGVGALVAPIRERLGVVRHWRIVELRCRLELLAARGVDRDAIEQLLQGAPA